MIDLGLCTTVGLNKASHDSFDYFSFQEVCGGLIVGFKAMHNLYVIHESIEKYGVTDQLKDLVSSSFESMGVSLSTEGVFKAIGGFIKKIGEQLKKLWEAFTGLFKRNTSALSGVKLVIETIEEAVKSRNLGDKNLTVNLPPLTELTSVLEELPKMTPLVKNTFQPKKTVFEHPDKIPGAVQTLVDFDKSIDTRLAPVKQLLTVNDAMSYLNTFVSGFNKAKIWDDDAILGIIKAGNEWLKSIDPNDPNIEKTFNLYELMIVGLKAYGSMSHKLTVRLSGAGFAIRMPIKDMIHSTKRVK